MSVIRWSQQGGNLATFNGAVLASGQNKLFWIDWSTTDLRMFLRTCAYLFILINLYLVSNCGKIKGF